MCKWAADLVLALSFVEALVKPGCEFNEWTGCGNTVKFVRPTAGSHASAPFWKGDRLAQPLLPSGQFLRQRLAGWIFRCLRESRWLCVNHALPLVSLHLPFYPPSPRGLFVTCTQPARPAAEGRPNVPAPRARPRPPVGLFRPRPRAGSRSAPARLRWTPPTPPHTSADAGRRRGQGREAGLGCRSDAAAHAGLLSRACSPRRPSGGRARWWQLRRRSAAFPSPRCPWPSGSPHSAL